MLPLIIYKFIQTTAEHFQGKRTAAALTTQKNTVCKQYKNRWLTPSCGERRQSTGQLLLKMAKCPWNCVPDFGKSDTNSQRT